MHIALFIRNLKGRGVSKAYLNWAKGLQEYFNVHFIIKEDIIEFDTSFLEYLHILSTKEQIDNLAQKYNINTIISNNVEFIEPTSIKNKFYSVHMLWSTRLYPKFRIKKFFKLRKEYKNKNVIANSDAVKEDLLKKLFIKPKRIDVINSGYDFDEIKSKSNENIELNPKSYILNIGAFSEEKNHKMLLEVYKNLNTSLDLVLIGEGHLKEEIKNLAKKLKIDSKVKFLGWKSNPYPYIKNAKLSLLTSTNEGLPGVAIESLVLNTPVVSFDSKGIRDILKDEFSKFIAVNKKELIEKTKIALNNYPKITEDLVNRFYYKNVAKKLKDLIDEVS